MKYIKDVFKVYNPIIDNYGVKLYHVYEIKGIRIKVIYSTRRFTFISDCSHYVDYIEKNGVEHISRIYKDIDKL